MKHLDYSDVKNGIETLDLTEFEHPRPLDRIVFQEEGDSYRDFNIRNETVRSWIESAERWENVPREAAFISDYFEADETLLDTVAYNMREELERPGLEGSKLATQALKAQRETPESGFGVVIGLPVREFEGVVNVHQALGPTGETPVRTPEWLENDDWYSDIQDDSYVGILMDDDTAYARHLRDNLKYREDDKNSFDPRFWKAYDETLDGFTGIF